MRAAWPYLLDGIVTGVALAGLLTVVGLLVGRPLAACGGWIFLGGIALAVASVPLALPKGRRLTGLLGWLRPYATEPPTPEERARLWMDRLISPRNVWLGAGVTMVALSFLPPFLAWRG